jgi:hypothetical protein
MRASAAARTSRPRAIGGAAVSTWCFSYGSNQSGAQLADRGATPSAVGLALLRDHRFAFDQRSRQGGSRANVVPARGRVVLGTCLALDGAGLDGLRRRRERGYVEREVEVEWLERPGERLRALAFVAAERAPDAGPPPEEYLTVILTGLAERSAPGFWRELVARSAALAPPAQRYAPLRRHDLDEAVGGALSLESALVRLACGWLPASDGDDGEDRLARLCASAVEGQRDGTSGFVAGSWSLLPDANAPKDARFEFGVRPSWVVASILALVRARFPRVASRVPGLDAALRRGLEFAAATELSGRGLDRTYGALRAIHDLADGGVPELLATEPDLCPALGRVLRQVRSGLADLARSAGPRGDWGVPARFEIEDALARLSGALDA